jgi:NADH-quinone oxidoreductase subunit C
MSVVHSAPRFASNDGVIEAVSATLGDRLASAHEAHGEVVLTVRRDAIADALEQLRDEHEYQQLMEIAGVDYPNRAERFEVVYMLLSLTRNHRLLVKVNAAEDTPVPTVTHLWPVAGWLEREVFDLYGVIFDGNSDLRRILTDYGFEGHPFRKDFPLTGYVELRYSEEDKRVVYEPVKLAQDLRSFDFMSPWEGADYVLPGDEKAVQTPPPPAAAPATPKTTEKAAETGAGKETNKAAAKKVARPGAPKVKAAKEPGALKPTSSRPDRKPRKKSADAKPSTAPEGS